MTITAETAKVQDNVLSFDNIVAAFSSLNDILYSIEPGDALLCAQTDPELFFSTYGPDIEKAKTICSGCEIRSECLQGALRRHEPWGVWGGEELANGRIVPAGTKGKERHRARVARLAAEQAEATVTVLSPKDQQFADEGDADLQAS